MNEEVKELIDIMKEYADGFTSVLAPTEESVKALLDYINQLESTLNEVREKIKLERKVSLGLEQVYTISVLDQLQNILNEVGGSNE